MSMTPLNYYEQTAEKQISPLSTIRQVVETKRKKVVS